MIKDSNASNDTESEPSGFRSIVWRHNIQVLVFGSMPFLIVLLLWLWA